MKYWYYVDGDKQIGPVTQAELEKLFQERKICPNTLVWTQEMSNWTRVCDVADLTSLIQSGTPHSTPPPLPIPPLLQTPPPPPSATEATDEIAHAKKPWFRESFWPAGVVAWSVVQVFKRMNPESGVISACFVGVIAGSIALFPFEFIYRRRWSILVRHMLALVLAGIVFVLATPSMNHIDSLPVAVVDYSKMSDAELDAELAKAADKVFTPAQSKEFISTEGRFAVKSTLQFKETVSSVSSKLGKLQSHKFEGDDGLRYRAVIYTDFPEGLGTNWESRLDSARDGLVADTNGRVIMESKITLGNYPGREIVVETKGQFKTAIIKVRLYVVLNRFYQVMVISAKGEGGSLERDDFLDSFRLLAR